MNADWNDDLACMEEKTRYARDLLERHAATLDIDTFDLELELNAMETTSEADEIF